MKEKRTFFVSGHRELTQEEFNQHYIPMIEHAIEKYDAHFVVGEYIGGDLMFQKYMADNHPNLLKNIVIFHMGQKPIIWLTNIKTLVGGFKDDIERDSAMTDASDEDIAWVRPSLIGKNSGTEQNINRRKEKILS